MLATQTATIGHQEFLPISMIAPPSVKLSNQLEKDWVLEEIRHPQPFHGEFPNFPNAFPKLNFEWVNLKNKIVCRTVKSAPFQFALEFHEGPNGSAIPELVRPTPSNLTTKSELYWTRFQFLYANSHHFEFKTGSKLLFRLKCEPLQEKEKQSLLHAAKFFRKLRFIEQVFGISNLLLSSEVSPTDVQMVDHLFRGITEGDFLVRGDSVSLTLENAQNIETLLSNNLGLSVDFRNFELWGRTFDTGIFHVTVSRPKLSDPRILETLKKAPQGPVPIRVLARDRLIRITFDRYAKKSPAERGARLRQFLDELRRNGDPEELISLVSEPLAQDVSEIEADRIAMAWVDLNELPYSFCPQKPEYQADRREWVVPIWLYFHVTKEGGPVGELFIDARSGQVTSATSIEEMNQRASAILETLDADA